jgi:hypothetical protein
MVNLNRSKWFFNYLLPYNASTNPSSPYGLATPNRRGYGGQASLSLLNGGLKPMILADMSSQQVGELTGNTNPAETYSVLGAGGVLDLMPIARLPLKLSGGWYSRGVKNDGFVNFNARQYNAGVEYNLGKQLLLYAGSKHIDYNGTLAYPVYGGYGDPLTGGLVNSSLAAITSNINSFTGFSYTYDESYDIYSVGLKYEITPTTMLEGSYSSQVYMDNLVATSHYEMDQAFLRFTLKF